MNSLAYLFALIISISGLAILDCKYQLAFWHDKMRTIKTIGLGVLVFTLWDLAGIALGIFFHGGSEFTLPVRLFPEYPLEELFFLILLCYVTLLIYQAGARRWPRT